MNQVHSLSRIYAENFQRRDAEALQRRKGAKAQEFRTQKRPVMGVTIS